MSKPFDNRRLEAHTRGWVNAATYGVPRGTGLDDAPILRAALAAARPIGKLLLPAGTYRIDTPLVITDVDVVGAGMGLTNLDFYGTGAAVTFAGTKGNRLSGVTITSRAATQTGLVVLGSWLAVEHIEILGFDTYGLQVGSSGVTGTYYSDFRNLFIRNATTQGVAGLFVTGPPPPSSNANHFANVAVNGRWTYLYRIDGTKNRFDGGDCIPDTRGTGVAACWYITGYQNEINGSYSELISGSAVPTKIVHLSSAAYSNRVVDLYLSYNSFNQTTHIVDEGWNNDLRLRPVGYNFQTTSMNVGVTNLLPNSGFDVWSGAEPHGWVTFTGTAAQEAAVVRGTAKAIKVTGAAENVNVSCFVASASAGDKSLGQIPIGYLRGKQITVGVWCRSAFAGVGNVRAVTDGTGGASYGAAHHSGGGGWEFLAASALVPADATKAGISFRSSNGGANLTGDVYFSEPILVVGTELPNYSPRALDDSFTWAAGALAGALRDRLRLSGSATWDPGSVAAGAYTSTTLTVTGAAVGDVVSVGFSDPVPAGCVLSGAVTVADTVTVTLVNHAAGAVDLASGTLRADVWQH